MDRKQLLQDLLDTRFGGSQAEFARAIKRSPAQVNQWVVGYRTLGHAAARHIETTLKLPFGWMDGKDGAAASVEEANISPAPQRRPIPVISWVQAGDFCDIVDLHEAGLTSEWFDGYTAKLSDQAFALVVQGDSMVSPYPGTHSFPPGTRIIVDPLQVPAAGEFCLAKDVAAQTATFKKLHHEDGRWYLKPLNPVFPMVEIDDPSLRVLGKVVESYLQVRL